MQVNEFSTTHSRKLLTLLRNNSVCLLKCAGLLIKINIEGIEFVLTV